MAIIARVDVARSARRVVARTALAARTRRTRRRRARRASACRRAARAPRRPRRPHRPRRSRRSRRRRAAPARRRASASTCLRTSSSSVAKVTSAAMAAGSGAHVLRSMDSIGRLCQCPRVERSSARDRPVPSESSRSRRASDATGARTARSSYAFFLGASRRGRQPTASFYFHRANPHAFSFL